MTKYIVQVIILCLIGVAYFPIIRLRTDRFNYTMNKTKTKIISTAIEVFNQRGFGTVNLKELSELMGISRGNLTYHFKSKETLLQAIVKEMWESISVEMTKTLEVPSFENLHHRINIYFRYQKKYAFIFLDAHVQMHPAVHARLKTMASETIKNYYQMIALGIQMGTIKEETVPGTYDSLVHALWMMVFYRYAGLKTQLITKDDNAEQLIWGLIWPHLTDKGQQGFKDFFGKTFYKKMGPSFDIAQHSFITF